MREPTRSGSPERILLDRIVKTDYGQFDLIWRDDDIGFGGDFGEVFGGQVNGLVGAASGLGVYVNLARPYGGSAIRIVLLDHRPVLAVDSWEDVVEVSFVVPVDALPRWSTWGHGEGGPLDLPPGSYRMRVGERGRDQAHANPDAPDALDAYLMQLWPEPPGGDVTLKVTSSDAAYWHATNGKRQWPRHDPPEHAVAR